MDNQKTTKTVPTNKDNDLKYMPDQDVVTESTVDNEAIEYFTE